MRGKRGQGGGECLCVCVVFRKGRRGEEGGGGGCVAYVRKDGGGGVAGGAFTSWEGPTTDEMRVVGQDGVAGSTVVRTYVRT